MRPTALLLSIAIASASPGWAVAQPKPTAAEAKRAAAKFKQAQKKFEKKDYEASLALAKEALDATGSPNARLYVARSLRELGRLDEAYEEMHRTHREALEAAKKDPKYEATRDSSAAELALLDQRVGKVIVALADAPPGARVELNGKTLESPRVGVPVAVAPGEVEVKATADGAEPVEKRVKVAAGQTQTVTLVFKESSASGAGEEAEPPPDIQATPDPEPKKTRTTGLRTAGYVSVGVGVAGLAVFAITGAMSDSKYNQLKSECGGKRCTDPKYADTVDSGKRLQTISTIGLIVGGVGLVAGGAMIIFGGSSKEKSASASVDVSPNGFSLGYARRF